MRADPKSSFLSWERTGFSSWLEMTGRGTELRRYNRRGALSTRVQGDRERRPGARPGLRARHSAPQTGNKTSSQIGGLKSCRTQ